MTDRSDEAAGATPGQKPLDPTFFKDIADVIRAKNIHFLPFFGAFIGFMVAKSQYLAEGALLNKLIVIAVLATCILYSAVVSQVLWVLEGLRFFTI